jgi:two-component system sensor histidine kinase YesM
MRRSIRFKLTLLFIATIVVPVFFIVIQLPKYYEKLITDQQASLMEGTLTALSFNIETYLDDLERMTVTPYFLQDDVMNALKIKSTSKWNQLTPSEQYTYEQYLYTLLPRFLRNLRKDILGTILLPMDGSVYATSPWGSTNQTVKDFPFKEQSWYKQAVKADGNVAFISVHDQDYLLNGGTKVFSVARLLKDPDTQRPLGVMMADADTIALERIMNGVQLSPSAIAVILDESGGLIYANKPLPGDMLTQLATVDLPGNELNGRYSIVKKRMSPANWETVVLLPKSVIKKQLRRIYMVGVGFAIAGLLIALFLYITVSRWLVKPFKRMVLVMKRVQRGDLGTFVQVRGGDEVAQLGQSLNTMISQLGELIDREFRAALGQRNAEYRALQSQIQPHFLYNTLNGFIGLNRSGQSALLESAILSLSGMLRYTLEQNDMVRLKEEIDFIAKYGELQQMRFSDKMRMSIELDPEAAAIPIPKLLIQPIVENAVIHGIEPCDRKCTLMVMARLRRPASAPGAAGKAAEAWLEIRVVDDGFGFLADERNEDGVGIGNVRERLRLAYDNASVRVESAPGAGTAVTILIPVKGEVDRG